MVEHATAQHGEDRLRKLSMQCRQCHEDLSVLNQRAVGRDLHPIHEGVTCTACHENEERHGEVVVTTP